MYVKLGGAGSKKIWHVGKRVAGRRWRPLCGTGHGRSAVQSKQGHDSGGDYVRYWLPSDATLCLGCRAVLESGKKHAAKGPERDQVARLALRKLGQDPDLILKDIAGGWCRSKKYLRSLSIPSEIMALSGRSRENAIEEWFFVIRTVASRAKRPLRKRDGKEYQGETAKQRERRSKVSHGIGTVDGPPTEKELRGVDAKAREEERLAAALEACMDGTGGKAGRELALEYLPQIVRMGVMPAHGMFSDSVIEAALRGPDASSDDGDEEDSEDEED